MKKSLGIFLVVFCIHCITCAKILVVLPSPILSHNIIYRTIYKELSLRGHSLTVFTPDPLRDHLLPNVKEIDMSYLYKEVENVPAPFHTGIGLAYQDIFLKISREVLTHPEMKKIINNPKTHFDLVLVEWSVNPSFGVLSKRFDCPMVGMRAKGLTLDGHDFMGNPTNPAYIPNGLTDFDGEFWSRMDNFLFGIMWRINYHFYTIPKAQNLVNKLFPEHADDLLEIQKNTTVIITNTHPVFTGVRPIVPGNIEVGGIHLGKEVVPLPQDILSFLDNAQEGAIYINLGSANPNIPNLTPNVVNIIASALSEVPYKVIWRWDEADPSVSLNDAFIAKWLPQEAILGHPNIKAFITNVGLQSFYEGIHSQVPLVGIPLFADQHINARKIEGLQVGKRLDVSTLDKDSLGNAIIKVAGTPMYKKNVKRASVLLHDLPMKPLDKAVWWIEYVLRHKGARHLRSAAVDLNWIVYLLLDVIAFVILCFLAAFTIAYYAIVWIRRNIRSLKQKYSKPKTE